MELQAQEKRLIRFFQRIMTLWHFVIGTKVKWGGAVEGIPVYSCEDEILKKVPVIIMGTSYPDAYEFCRSVSPAHPTVIPYECTRKLYHLLNGEENVPNYELEQRHLNTCQVLCNRGELLKKMVSGGIYAEIGVERGDFSAAILEICKPEKLYLVDLWEGELDGNQGLDNMRYVQERFKAQIKTGQIEVIKSDSCVALNKFSDFFFDFIYLDTVHNYSVPSAELSIAKNKLKKSAYLCGHDYCNRALSRGNRYGVKEAVNEFCVKNEYAFAYITMELHGHYSYALKKI